ncbi:MAG: hypothetical protein ACJAUV_000655 [Flavobacteriales bacterium]|jgi:hypothetical protein
MHRIMEWFWLVIGIVSLIAVSVFSFVGGDIDGGVVFVFPCLAFLMFFIRRTFRKKHEKMNEQ